MATPPNAARHLYRLDFVLSSGDASPAAGEHLTMNLLENDIGEIRNDMNLPLSNGTDPSRPTGPIGARVEVGTTLKANYTTLGDDLVLQTSTELSGTDEPGSIRKLSAHGDALVTPGKPALVASVDDASGHKRYELTVTATKLR